MTTCADHTVCPEGYLSWHAWAEKKADVERVEPMAMGHIDYARKLALYACELSWADPS